MKKIGLFGGTFNPPHKGHIRAAEEFAKNMDFVYFMPASLPPHKEISGFDCPAARFGMAKAAFSEITCPHVISPIELMRKGKSFSIDTVNQLLKFHGCEKIYMYIGSDMLFYFERWKNFEELFGKCVIVTAARSEADEKIIRRVLEEYKEKYGCEYYLMPISPLEISSTEIREAVSGGSSELLKNYLTDSVHEYIINNALYEDKKMSDDITGEKVITDVRETLVSMIDGKRLSHTLSVEKQACEMAKLFLPLYGYEKKYIRDISAAALLHDITKNYTKEQHEEYLSAFLCPPFSAESVYHSCSSAFYALERYLCNLRVFRAVYYHTTGCADMDIFEKIIYLSDFIEPERQHEACVSLREIYYERINDAGHDAEKLKNALDRTILDSLMSTYRHLEENGRKIDPLLFEAAEFLTKQLEG